MRGLLVPAAIAVLLLAALTGVYASAYTVIDLGTFGGATHANDINNLGQVVGESAYTNGTRRAFLWQNGVMQDVHTMTDRPQSVANGINNNSQIVGCRFTPDTAFIVENGVMKDMGIGGSSYGNEINDHGQIAGMIAGNGGRAVLVENGNITWLGTLGYNNSNATDINNSKQIVGYFGDWWPINGNNFCRAFIWQNNVMTDLGTLGGNNSAATAINESGLIAGYSLNANGILRAVTWQNQVISELGTIDNLKSLANDVNNLGSVVGYSYATEVSVDGIATLWMNGNAVNLNGFIPTNSGWVLQNANAINDSGQIVGYGLHNGEIRSFLLNPVPEPSSILALLVGMGGFAWRRRR